MTSKKIRRLMDHGFGTRKEATWEIAYQLAVLNEQQVKAYDMAMGVINKSRPLVTRHPVRLYRRRGHTADVEFIPKKKKRGTNAQK